MDKNRLTKWWSTVEEETGSKKFVTMNIVSIVTALTIWVILYNTIPDAPVIQTLPQTETSKSTKTKKENV